MRKIIGPLVVAVCFVALAAATTPHRVDSSTASSPKHPIAAGVNVPAEVGNGWTGTPTPEPSFPPPTFPPTMPPTDPPPTPSMMRGAASQVAARSDMQISLKHSRFAAYLLRRGVRGQSGPSNFEVVWNGNLAAQIPASQPLPWILNPFCNPGPPSGGCNPAVQYFPAEGVTIVKYGPGTLYPPNSGDSGCCGHPTQYHFGLMSSGVTGCFTSYAWWSFPSGPPQYVPWVTINPQSCPQTQGKYQYATLYYEGSFSPKGPSTAGWWEDIGYIPNGSGQPKFTFSNYTIQPIYLSNTGIVLNQPVPTAAACRKNPACKPNQALIRKLNWQGMPPPEAPHSPFQPLQAPPPAVLDPVGACGDTLSPLSPKGGVLTLPVCEDFGGTLQYPPNKAPSGTTASLVSYPLPPPPSGGWGTPKSGTVLWYISTLLNSSANQIAFGETKKLLVIKSHRMSPANNYSLYVFLNGQQLGNPLKLGVPKCAATCVLSAQSPFNGETVPANVTFWFEVVQN
jgi:hypothetical protein